jgi:hypothetical protein
LHDEDRIKKTEIVNTAEKSRDADEETNDVEKEYESL